MCAWWTACRLPTLKVFAGAEALQFYRALLLIPLFLCAGSQMAQGQGTKSVEANVSPRVGRLQLTTPGSGIALVSRLSDAQAYAEGGGGPVNPPPQTQTDLLPANLSNSAQSYGEPGGADSHFTSNSTITVDNKYSTLHVTGD